MIDLTDTKANTFEPLAAGTYPVKCVSADVLHTKSGTGHYIAMNLEVTGGDNEGRRLFTNFNIVNNSVKAVEIGKSQLKSFLLKSKFKDPDHLNDVADLVGLECFANVTIKRDETYGDKNEIKYWSDTFTPGSEKLATGFAETGAETFP